MRVLDAAHACMIPLPAMQLQFLQDVMLWQWAEGGRAALQGKAEEPPQQQSLQVDALPHVDTGQPSMDTTASGGASSATIVFP